MRNELLKKCFLSKRKKKEKCFLSTTRPLPRVRTVLGPESYRWVLRKMAEAGNQIGSPTADSKLFPFLEPSSVFALQPPQGGVRMERGEEEPDKLQAQKLAWYPEVNCPSSSRQGPAVITELLGCPSLGLVGLQKLLVYAEPSENIWERLCLNPI